MTDVIDRLQAVRIAREYCHPENIARELERMPSAQKTGRWVPQGPFLVCDQCGMVAGYTTDWKWCPGCGSYNGGTEE